jgi:hypothetical protein
MGLKGVDNALIKGFGRELSGVAMGFAESLMAWLGLAESLVAWQWAWQRA